MPSENWAKRQNKSNKKPTEQTKTDLWFEVDAEALKRSQVEALQVGGKALSPIELFPKVLEKQFKGQGKYVAMDCEFVGVGADGVQHALARVSLVNFHGDVLLDTHVKPIERIVDYRTHISGVKPEHLLGAPSFQEVQLQVAKLLSDKIIIGHGLSNDFSVLMLSHPRKLIRDTSKLRKFRAISRGKTPSLRRLAQEILGVSIQDGAHDSVDDARVAMLLYRSCKNEWENALFRNEGKKFKEAKRAKKLKQRPKEDCCSESFLSQLSSNNTTVTGGKSSTLMVNMKYTFIIDSKTNDRRSCLAAKLLFAVYGWVVY